jgi:hypothetical protein
VIRSDAGVAHRLSLSARVVSAGDSQVKAKRQGEKRLWRLQNRPFRALEKLVEGKLQRAPPQPNLDFTRVLWGDVPSPRETSRSIVVIIVIAVAGLIGFLMRLVALIVPELSIRAVGRKQLRVRTALDGPAA